MHALLLGLVLAAAPATEDTVPLYDDLGDHHHPVTTTHARAQAYFDQGLRLHYGFNHAEAIRSYERAAELDPTCAMCYWGVALSLGPNINGGMDEASGRAAWDAITRARSFLADVTPQERAYIEALTLRYGEDPLADRAARNRAWADAMTEVATRWSEDDDARVLAAAAQMNLSPWDYWTTPEEPRTNGARALDLLTEVTERSPEHVGACHYYIHLVEEHHPERAVPCAERLPDLMPGAGHIVHMPAHVYIRVGRYAEAVERNVHAAHADEEHLGDFAPDAAYLMAYYPHNYHFLWFAASMAGMEEVAVDAARKTSERVDTDVMRVPELRMLQHFWVTPFWALVRFQRWDDVLAEPAPAEDLVYPRGVWRYARALAYAARGDVDRAETELEHLRSRISELRENDIQIWDLNPATGVLEIAERTATAEVLAERGSLDQALSALDDAVRMEEALVYDEPPTWHLPVQQIRGHVLLAAERATDAAAAFQADLDRFPENGWSLSGLADALDAQGRTAEAEVMRERAQEAFGSSGTHGEGKTAHRHHE